MLTLLAEQPESLWDEALPVEVREPGRGWPVAARRFVANVANHPGGCYGRLGALTSVIDPGPAPDSSG